jgi:hypothetical protein
MLHTTGVALCDDRTANLAQRCLEQLTSLITEVYEVVPHVVVEELQDDVDNLHHQAASEANRMSYDAWDGEHVHMTHQHKW